jgi:hypothetical protein
MLEVNRRDFLKLTSLCLGATGLTSLGFDRAKAEMLKQNHRIELAVRGPRRRRECGSCCLAYSYCA